MRRARGVGDERGADLLADALHDVQDAGRQPRLVREVGEQRARQRRPLGGLEDDRAARREGRRGLPRREHERRVPRRDHDGRPGRHADDPVRRPVRRPHALLVALGQVGVAAVVAGAAQDHPGLAASAPASPCRRTRRARGARRRARSGRRAVAGTARGRRGRAPPMRGTRRVRRRGRAPPRAPLRGRPGRAAPSRSASGRRSARATRRAVRRCSGRSRRRRRRRARCPVHRATAIARPPAPGDRAPSRGRRPCRRT